MQKKYMPPLIVQCILILFIGSSLLAGISNTKVRTMPAFSTNTKVSPDKNLNQSEQMILNVLSACRLSENKVNENHVSLLNTYQGILETYFCRTDIDIKRSESLKAIRKIQQLGAVIHIEQKEDFRSMSIDGREYALRILKDIYEILGLKLTCSLKGDIIQVMDNQGRCIYKEYHTSSLSVFRFDVLFITISVILFFLILCFYIARKNHVFVKGVTYDGLNKEGYA